MSLKIVSWGVSKMNIVLYENCILTPAYREVFDTVRKYGNFNKTAFAQYLETLYHLSLTIQNQYLQDSGILRLPIGYQDSNYEVDHGLLNYAPYMYNYMKVTMEFKQLRPSDGSNIGTFDRIGYVERYYFISNITISNNIAIIQYNVDYWHTYRHALGGIKTKMIPSSSNYSEGQYIFKSRYGFLTSSKIVDYSPTNFKLQFYKPPLEYTGNNQLKINKLKDNTSYQNNTRGYLIVKMSLFKTAGSGVMTERKNKVFVLHYREYDPMEPHGMTPSETTFSSAPLYEYNYTNVLNLLVLKSSTQKIGFPNDTDYPQDYYYQITEAFFVPESMASYTYNNIEYKPFDAPANPIYFSTLYLEELDRVLLYDVSRIVGQYTMIDPTYPTQGNLHFIGSNVVLNEGFIDNNFKLLGIGLYTHIISLTPNGNPINYKISFSASDFDIKIYIHVQNTITEITDDLQVNIPISSDSADVTALNRITRSINNSILENKKEKALISRDIEGIGSVANVLNGASGLLLSHGISGYGSMLKGLAGLSAYDDIANIEVEDIENKFILNNAKVYTSNKGLVVSNSGETNAFYGLITVEINADNDTEVERAINAFGYNCSEIVNIEQILTLDDTVADREKYNVVKFADVTVHGSFPQNVGKVLETILKNGVKIWYTHEVQ